MSSEAQTLHGLGIQFTLVAFLLLWLSRHVFDGRSQDRVHTHVFRIATMLAHGHVIALGSIFLGSLLCRPDLTQECYVLTWPI